MIRGQQSPDALELTWQRQTSHHFSPGLITEKTWYCYMYAALYNTSLWRYVPQLDTASQR